MPLNQQIHAIRFVLLADLIASSLGTTTQD